MIPATRRSVRDRHDPVLLLSSFHNASVHYRQVGSVQFTEKELHLRVLMSPSAPPSLSPSAVVQPFGVGTLKDITGLVDFLASQDINDGDLVTGVGQLYYAVAVNWFMGQPLSAHSLPTFKKHAVRLGVHWVLPRTHKAAVVILAD